MILQLLLTVVLFLLIMLMLVKWHFFQLTELPKSAVFLAFFVKLITAYGLWAIYSYYYTDRSTADIFKYFDDASYLFEVTKDNLSARWQLILGLKNQRNEMDLLLANTHYWDSSTNFIFNDNRSMIRIHLLLYHLSSGFYHFHLFFFTFLSLIGSIGLYRFFINFSSINRKALFISIVFIPSLLFWCSAPLKESWLLFGMGLFLYGLSTLLNNQKKNWFGLLIGLLILCSIKIYILLSLIPALFFLILTSIFKKLKSQYSFLLSHLFFGILFLLFANSIVPTLSQKLVQFKTLAAETKANSSIEATNFSDLKGLIVSLPHAVFNVFLKPSFPNQISPFSLMTSIENSLLLLLLGLPFVYFKKPKPQELNLALFCFSFLFISASIIGLTCPILGAIVRYRAPLLPFYLILLLTFVDLKRIKRISKL